MKISNARSSRAGALRSLLVAVVTLGAVTNGCDCAKKGGEPPITSSAGDLITLSNLNFGNVAVGQHARLSLPLRNGGDGELTILSQVIGSDATNSFTEPTQLSSPLLAGGSTNAILEFTPTQAGPLTAVLELTDDGTPPSAAIALNGTGIDINVVASPPSVNFGSVQVEASPAPTQTVTFTNDGTGAAQLTVDPSGTEPEFTVTDPLGTVSSVNVQMLAPGGTYTVQVAFEPDMTGNFSSSFNFTACANATTCLAVESVSLNGVGITGQIAITPDPVGFSNVPAGNAATQTITVQNVGSNAANITCVYLPDGGDSDCDTGDSIFAFSDFSSGAPSTSAPVLLAAGASFTFTMTYTATTDPNGDSDTLEVDYLSVGASDGGTATDPILGNQTLNPCSLTITPAAINFGTVTVGTTLTKAATLTNSGDQTCQVTGIALDSTSDPSYSLDPSQASTLSIPAGGSATITVDFNLNNSSTPNTRKGTVDFASSDPNNATGTIPLVATLNASNPYATGWPKWHYDNNNSGQTSADTSANTGTLVWKFTGLTSAVTLNNNGSNARCGGEAYLNSPVVSDNPVDGGYYVYQMSLDGNLYAFDQNGNKVWETMTSDPATDPHPSTPAVAKSGNIWVISGSDDTGGGGGKGGGKTNTVNDLFYMGPTGSILYSEPYGEDGFDACPGLGPDGTLFEADDDGEVGTSSTVDPFSAIAFTASTTSNSVSLAAGAPFPLTTESERFGVAIGDDDSSYWGNNGQFFAVTPPTSGFKLNGSWPAAGVTLTSNANDANCTGPVYSDLAIDPINTNFVYAYSAWEDGSNCGGGLGGLGGLGGGGGGCSAAGGGSGGSGCTAPYTVQGMLVALSLMDGSTQWTLSLPATQLPSGWTQLCSDYGNGAPAVAVDGTVYVGNSDGLRSVVGATGAVNWLFKSANVTSSPAIGGDGTIFYGAADGSFYAVNPNGTLKFKYAATGVISSSPAIADDGTVFFVSDDGVLWAVK